MNGLAFELPPALEAHRPPEARGLARDDVRLMVASRGDDSIVHARFADLPAFLAAGDVLVVNTSATLPAAVAVRRQDGERARLHVAMPAPQHAGTSWWVVELRSPTGAEPARGRDGERLLVADGVAVVELVAPYAASPRLWLARARSGASLELALQRHGEPIRYGYVRERRPLRDYQTVFALDGGSAEMPSAGRPFSTELVTRLVASGVHVVPVTLHTGVSSPERHEPPYPERYAVPEETARLVNAARGWGGRIVAVGTTAVRALETVADADGAVHGGWGWTGLVVTPERGVRAVDGIITGWHEPQASHLQLLEAIAGERLLARCYAEALARRYLWHEFGDSHLILP